MDVKIPENLQRAMAAEAEAARNARAQVIQAEGPSMVMGEDRRGERSLILTYHRHMFGLGEHYNSVAIL